MNGAGRASRFGGEGGGVEKGEVLFVAVADVASRCAAREVRLPEMAVLE